MTAGESTSSVPLLAARFDDAVVFAPDLHRHQLRKGSRVPYVAHLLAVCSIVLEHGGVEDEAIAALLHDGPEDQGEEATLQAIRDRFGDTVAGIVAECSDTFEQPKPPWVERKARYLEHLDWKDPATRRKMDPWSGAFSESLWTSGSRRRHSRLDRHDRFSSIDVQADRITWACHPGAALRSCIPSSDLRHFHATPSVPPLPRRAR